MAAAVASLHFYPVKSCRGVTLTSATIGARGIQNDRRWMIVDEAGTFLTQRTVPRLALVDATLKPDRLVLSAEGHGRTEVPAIAPGRGPRLRVRVWRSEVDAVDCGPEAARWIAEWIHAPAALVFLPDDSVRPVLHASARPGDQVGFADGFPLLLTTDASLGDLNARMDAPLPMDRFRPNVVVTGSAAWAEDGWQRLRIGSVPVRVAKPCDRCVITTTDQRTGERGVEPLHTLATFRRRDSGVLFGQNCIPENAGTVSVGDPVVVVG